MEKSQIFTMKQGFGWLPREIIDEASELSAKAKGILLYLNSRPDGWQFYQADIIERFSDGKASIRSGLDELKQHGYLTIDQERNEDGSFAGRTWRLHPPPESKQPGIRKPDSGDPATNNKNSNKKDSTKSEVQVQQGDGVENAADTPQDEPPVKPEPQPRKPVPGQVTENHRDDMNDVLYNLLPDSYNPDWENAAFNEVMYRVRLYFDEHLGWEDAGRLVGMVGRVLKGRLLTPELGRYFVGHLYELAARIREGPPDHQPANDPRRCITAFDDKQLAPMVGGKIGDILLDYWNNREYAAEEHGKEPPQEQTKQLIDNIVDQFASTMDPEDESLGKSPVEEVNRLENWSNRR